MPFMIFSGDAERNTDSLHLTRSATNHHENDEVVHQIVQNTFDLVDDGLGWNPAEEPYLNWWAEESVDRPRGRWTHPPEVT